MPKALKVGDFVVETRQGVQLIVEAKKRRIPSRREVVQYRSNLLRHFLMLQSEYFLLALGDHLYLWRGGSPPDAEPEYVGDTAAALKPQLDRIGLPLEELGQISFEMLILAWLNELIMGTLEDSVNRPWLEASGLAAAVRNGSLDALNAA